MALIVGVLGCELASPPAALGASAGALLRGFRREDSGSDVSRVNPPMVMRALARVRRTPAGGEDTACWLRVFLRGGGDDAGDDMVSNVLCGVYGDEMTM
jgi:hypothetical protein